MKNASLDCVDYLVQAVVNVCRRDVTQSLNSFGKYKTMNAISPTNNARAWSNNPSHVNIVYHALERRSYRMERGNPHQQSLLGTARLNSMSVKYIQ
jgi:hypothetical protein